MTGSPSPHADLSDAVDRVSRHELERQVERLSAELTKLRRTLAPLARFRTLIDQAGEAMFVIDAATGRFVDVNETALRWLGLARSRLLQLTVNDVHVEFPLEYRETRADHVTDTRNLDRPWIHGEGVHRRRDGTCFPVDVAVAQRRFADRTFILVVARESKRRQRAEHALREAEGDYHSLFDLSHDAIYITTRDGRIARVNRAAVERFGYPEQDLIGLEARALYTDAQDIRRFQEIVEESGYVRDFPIQFRARDGSVFLGLLTATLRHTGDGAIGGYQCLIRCGADPSETFTCSEEAGEIERAAQEDIERPCEDGSVAESADHKATAASVADNEDAPAERSESREIEQAAASYGDLEAHGVISMPDWEEASSDPVWEEEPCHASEELASDIPEDRAGAGPVEDDVTPAVAPDDPKRPRELGGPSQSTPGAGPVKDQHAGVVFSPLMGSAHGYEVHAGAPVTTRSAHRSSRKCVDAGRIKEDPVGAAPWQRRPAPPPVAAKRRPVFWWSLLTLGVVLSLVGWTDAAVAGFPYNIGVQEWQYALRFLAGGLVALGIAGPRGKGAARALAVVCLGVALVMLFTYGAYLLDFPFGLRDVVSDAELDSARRRASEFTAVTVLGCVGLAAFLWRLGRAR
ncbi:MAG: PAS domain S-box protein [Gemmatimonadota bacterium]|nr:MAG: PAS domain S-box protein [Gemmatimonadota bacterium]